MLSAVSSFRPWIGKNRSTPVFEGSEVDRKRTAIIPLLFLYTFVVSSAPPEEDRIENVPGVMDGIIFQYRLVVRDFLDRRCNFSPSCSHYGQTVLSSHGPVIGTMMALERWTRCHSTAGRLDYYSKCGNGNLMSDPLEIDEGNVIWDSLLLPF